MSARSKANDKFRVEMRAHWGQLVEELKEEQKRREEHKIGIIQPCPHCGGTGAVASLVNCADIAPRDTRDTASNTTSSKTTQTPPAPPAPSHAPPETPPAPQETPKSSSSYWPFRYIWG